MSIGNTITTLCQECRRARYYLFICHEREIRNALREGRFKLCDCSADQEDESLFTAKVQARIMASMVSPFSPGCSD